MTLQEIFEKNGGISREEIAEYLAAEQEPIEEKVYGTLTGNLKVKYRLPWVESVFEPGLPCYEAYSRMHDAYERLRERLGVVDEDRDVEEIIDSLLEYGELLAMEMFRCGRKYQKMQESHTPVIPGG